MCWIMEIEAIKKEAARESVCSVQACLFQAEGAFTQALEPSTALQRGSAGVSAGTAGNTLFKSHVCLRNASKEKAICI